MVKVGDKVRITQSLRPLAVAYGEEYVGLVGTVVDVIPNSGNSKHKYRYRVQFERSPTVTWSIIEGYFVPEPMVEAIW